MEKQVRFAYSANQKAKPTKPQPEHVTLDTEESLHDKKPEKSETSRVSLTEHDTETQSVFFEKAKYYYYEENTVDRREANETIKLFKKITGQADEAELD